MCLIYNVCVKISFPLNILRLNGWNLATFSLCAEIDEINYRIVMRISIQINN